MTITIQAALEGSDAVRIGGRLYIYPVLGNGAGGPMARAARKLIRDGTDPDTLVRLTRDGISVYAEDSSLRSWAEVLATKRPRRVRKDLPPV